MAVSAAPATEKVTLSVEDGSTMSGRVAAPTKGASAGAARRALAPTNELFGIAFGDPAV